MAETETKPQRRRVEPGWHRDIPAEEYHHGTLGTSSSQLKTLIEHTPAHLRALGEVTEEPKLHLSLGQAFHTLTLEPDKFDDDVAIEPEVNKRTKAGKAEIEAFLEANPGKAIITKDQHEIAKAMAASARSHPIVSILLQDIVVESSVYWWYQSQDVDDGTHYKELVKVRPDVLSRPHPVIIDLKSSRDAGYSAYARFAHRYLYHLSSAMYMEGVNQCKPLLEEMGHFAYTKFVHIVVESQAPYLTAVYEIDSEAINIGKALFRRAMQRLHHGRENNWPGFPEEIRVLELPTWANRVPTV